MKRTRPEQGLAGTGPQIGSAPRARGAPPAARAVPTPSRIAFIGLIAAAGGAIAYAVSRVSAPPDPTTATASIALTTLLDVGQALLRDIERVVQPAMERTRKLASSPAILRALQTGDSAAQTAACNAAVTGATEIDALALFDHEGRICAMNTVYADGKPIDRARVDRVLHKSFADRDIIQSCARNGAQRAALEFQTTCDITPALFDSTGLSVAYSTPVVDNVSGERIGVLSSRLRFERLSDLILARRVGGKPDSIQFVTDEGGYFSERINAGEVEPPAPPDVLASIVAPLVQGSSDQVLVRHGPMHLMVFRLLGFSTLEGGGIQVMLSADDAWLAREARQGRLLEAGSSALIGTLLLLVAATLRSATISARDRRVIAAQKLELEGEMAVRQRVEAERAKLAESLIDASRRAGMAEVATGVLHNVGNALNSVNVSAGVVKDRVNGLKVDNLAKASTLLRDHSSDLASFLDVDEKGKRIPAYLLKLAESLASDQQAICAELGALTEGIDHIKTIVSTQQEYSSAGGLVEDVSIVETIEAALRIHIPRADRHHVCIVREFAELPPVRTDKHKLAQILLNLLNNAFQAMREPSDRGRTLTLRSGASGDRVTISVTDTGCGIARDNLTRVFSYGFTTKKNGHGFGLHSSANAAAEMGGTLTAHSDGLNAGATFTLELPLRNEVASPWVR